MGLFNVIFKSQDNNRTYYLEWQELITGTKSTKLYMSKAELLSSSEFNAENCLRILNDSFRIIAQTNAPDVFFSRCNLIEENLDYAIKLQKYVSFNIQPSVLQEQYNQEIDSITSDFINRYAEFTRTKAVKLKTTSGKLNNCQKYYDSLKPYFDKLSLHNINLTKSNYEAMIEFFNINSTS